MGNKLFGVDIAGIVAKHVGPGVLDAQITREAQGTQRTPGNLTGGLIKAAPVSWPCKGFWEDFTGTPPPGVEIEANDRKAILIGDTIPPAALPLKLDDKITIEGQSLFMVKVLARDPAAATYTLLCRDRRTGNAV